MTMINDKKFISCKLQDISYFYIKSKNVYEIFDFKTNKIFYITPKEKRKILKNIILSL